ncbi:hypothetical protein, conserved [Angomonas deanei]|uniref:Galactosyltransferase n=1 Tax=Angomonas deanei TaxID=59799 RepID=A0A7G2CNG1_9TRYP|nr:hypothetical protein, conserved [Angomonas deanei]
MTKKKRLLRILLAVLVCLSICLLFSFPPEGRKVSVYKSITSEQSIRGQITPLHVVLTCSAFNATHDPSLYGALAAAKEKHATVGCGAAQGDASMYPWWALPSSEARKVNPYILVQSIQAVDSDRRSLRNAQRDTFLRYKGAATRRNGFRGRILFLYVLAAHHSTTESLQVTDYRDATVVSGGDESLRTVTPPTGLYTTSFAVEESLEYLDVLWMTNFRDARPATRKRVGQGGNWGTETEVGMTRKLITYMLYASYQFPDVPFIGRGDDDAFYKIPQILIELESMQAEMDSFNRQSKRYHVQHSYWGGYSFLRNKGIFSPGWFLVVSNSILQVWTTAISDLAEEKEKDELLLRHAQVSGSDAVQVGIVAALSPYDPQRLDMYTAYWMNHDDVFIGVLVNHVREYLQDTTCQNARNRCEMVYYRVEPGRRAQNWYDLLLVTFLHRRNTFVMHRAKTPLLHYQLFLYFSNPSQLFSYTDSTTEQFVKELRWGEEDTYDEINFTALQQSPLWEELFPSDLTQRAAALNRGPRWWDDTLLIKDAQFDVGVSWRPFTVFNATKKYLLPPTADVGEYGFAFGILPREDLSRRCKRASKCY